MSGPPPAWRSGSRSHADALAFGMKDQSMFPDVINFVFVGVLFSLPGCCMSLPIVGVALILCLTDCNHSRSPVQCYIRWYIWSLAQCYPSEFQRCPKAKSHRYLCSLLCIFKKACHMISQLFRTMLSHVIDHWSFEVKGHTSFPMGLRPSVLVS